MLTYILQKNWCMWHLHCFRTELGCRPFCRLGNLGMLGLLGADSVPSLAASLPNTLLSQPSTSSSHCSHRTCFKWREWTPDQDVSSKDTKMYCTSWNSSRKERSYSPLQCCSIRCSMSLCRMEVTASELTHSRSCSLELWTHKNPTHPFCRSLLQPYWLLCKNVDYYFLIFPHLFNCWYKSNT